MFREFSAAFIHQHRINLVIDETIYLQNTSAQIFAVSENALFKFLHYASKK